MNNCMDLEEKCKEDSIVQELYNQNLRVLKVLKIFTKLNSWLIEHTWEVTNRAISKELTSREVEPRFQKSRIWGDILLRKIELSKS